MSVSERVVIPTDVWKQIEKTAIECRKTWGFGFPIISITLLKQILMRKNADKPQRFNYLEKA